jgi:hypothetical protein
MDISFENMTPEQLDEFIAQAHNAKSGFYDTLAKRVDDLRMELKEAAIRAGIPVRIAFKNPELPVYRPSKYRLEGPEGVKEWSGYGAKPKWMKDYIANGGDPENLRVNTDDDE